MGVATTKSWPVAIFALVCVSMRQRYVTPYRYATPCCRWRLLFFFLSILLLAGCQTTVVPPAAEPASAKPAIDAYGQPQGLQPTVVDVARTPPPIQTVPSAASAWPVYHWSQYGRKPVQIGVILPLHGRYARYGRTLLNGIRLAVNGPDWRPVVKLTVMDAADGGPVAVRAYEQLARQGVDWVLGPLLKKNVEAIIPHLREDLPVISLSKHSELAQRHPALFVHSIARGIQAAFMAREAMRAGMHRVAVVSSLQASARLEAEAFSQAFTALGGEVAGSLALDRRQVNYVNRLRTFRAVIDDDVVLRDLDLGLRVFSPLRQLDVRIPPGVDGFYMAMPGAMVAKLAGQLAYVDLRKVPMLGSNRWQDGHLLDDSGRYLSRARFCQPVQPDSAGPMVTQYRETWGGGQPDALFALGYDTAHIALLLGSRLGLHGQRAVQALHEQTGFPAESGRVRFNAQGVGEKEFDVFALKDRHVVLVKRHG